MTVDALRQGSVEVLDVLLAEYGQELQRVAYLILRDGAAAEDVVADTLVTALERGATLRDGAALRRWLLRIATNHALTHRRRRMRVVALEIVPDLPDERERVGADDRAALWQGVTELPVRMRAAIVLRYYADLPVDDVAAALGVSPNTVKAQLQTGLDRLRRRLADGAAGRGGASCVIAATPSSRRSSPTPSPSRPAGSRPPLPPSGSASVSRSDDSHVDGYAHAGRCCCSVWPRCCCCPSRPSSSVDIQARCRPSPPAMRRSSGARRAPRGR